MRSSVGAVRVFVTVEFRQFRRVALCIHLLRVDERYDLEPASAGSESANWTVFEYSLSSTARLLPYLSVVDKSHRNAKNWLSYINYCRKRYWHTTIDNDYSLVEPSRWLSLTTGHLTELMPPHRSGSLIDSGLDFLQNQSFKSSSRVHLPRRFRYFNHVSHGLHRVQVW